MRNADVFPAIFKGKTKMTNFVKGGPIIVNAQKLTALTDRHMGGQYKY